jgi:uncharacterized protein YeaO (DUF488 family)
MRQVVIKRVYDPPSPADGVRVLVDRIWPRGLSKPEAVIEIWARDVAPSAALRRWFGHDPARWDEFQRRYRAELQDRPDALRTLLAAGRGRRLTLLFGARDAAHNQAVVLKHLLEEAGPDPS